MTVNMTKEEKYLALLPQIQALLDGETDEVARREAGSSFCAVVHARIKAEGTMMVLRCIMPCMASCTQNSGVMPLRANTTPARSLNSVSTGPGQSAHT